MLNAKQIVDEGLLLLEHTQGKPAQVGYDLSLKAVQKQVLELDIIYSMIMLLVKY